MTDENERRNSRALEPELITDPVEKAEKEARNGLEQYDLAEAMALAALDRGNFKLRPSLILGLHRAALEGLSLFAGNWRPAGVEIEKSKHTPPGAHLVPELIEAMCEYVNDNWAASSPVHLAAYVLWRLNWIHPFADGNGRTARALSFVVICVKSEQILPGNPTYPEMIVQHRRGYFDALDAADAAFKTDERIDVSEMEQLLGSLVAKQLAAIYEKVTGKKVSE